jgi:hypothetical protein
MIEHRKPIRTSWALLGQWWCIPIDITDEEKQKFLDLLRDDLGEDFEACPLEYIEDRLYGGIECGEDENRRHVYFAVGQYSFLSAREGRYWKLDDEDRSFTWANVIENNQEYLVGDGPFTHDMPEC